MLKNKGKHFCGRNYKFFFFGSTLSLEEMKKELVDKCIKIGGENCPLVNHAKMAIFCDKHIYINIEQAKNAVYPYDVSQIARGYIKYDKDWKWVVCVKYE